MSKNKYLTIIISLLAIMSLLVGCTQQATTEETEEAASSAIKVGVSIANFNDTFLTYMTDGMKEYAASLGGDVEVTYVDAKEDTATQLAQVENFISQGMNAIVVVPVDTAATDPITAAAKEANTPLVYVNRLPANLPDDVVFVGSDSIDAGLFQMQYIVDKLGGKGNVVIMMGKLDNEAALQRTAGVEQIAADYPDIKITKKDTANWSREEGLTLMENWLSTGDQIDAVASNNDDMALGAIQAIEAAGLLGKIIVGGTDATPDALAAMKDGKLDVTVFQDAAGQGSGAIKAAVALAKGETVETRVMIPYVLVTPDNFEEFTGEKMDEKPAGTGKVKVGVSIANFNDTFLTYMTDGMKEYAASLGEDVEVTYVDAKEDTATQLAQVENFITQGMNAIVVVPVDTAATDPITAAAKEANTPLVYVNRLPANLPDDVVFVGSDSIDAGLFQMQYIVDKLGGKGNVVIMMGKLDNEAALQRTAGVEQIAADYPDIKITKKDTANWSREEGLTLMENWLSTGDQIDAVASNNDDMALGAIQAIEAAGLLGKIIVGGTDATPDALAAMKDGKLDVTVFQDAAGQGGGAIKAAVALARGEAVEYRVMIPYVLVTPENYEDFMN